MKKIFLLISALLTGTLLMAQESSIHFGLKAAPSLAWLKTDSEGIKSDGSKFGFAYGLITEFSFSEQYAFATGIDIAYRGGKLTSTTTLKNSQNQDSTIKASSEFNIQFIELPLTLKLKTKEIGYLTYFLQVGVAPGINIRARADQSLTTESNQQRTTSSSDDQDVKDNINNFNLSMIIGGGVEYTLSGSTVLLAGVQFNNGFMDVFDGPGKVNSNYLALTIGVLF
ncbi:MAG: PorT family protein [Bacteroidia bacterium]|nr:PorT family protein [Bacteroidia bacterium]